MKKMSLMATLLLAALLLAACAGATGDASQATAGPTASSGESPVAESHLITPEKAKEMMDAGGEYILLDVRTQGEFDAGHIPGAILIPDFELASRAEAELPQKDAVILLYCRSGNRSASSARTLVEMGYTNVYDFGGINSWPYETQTP